MPWVFEVLIPLRRCAMSLSALRLAEPDHPLPRTSRRWNVGHAHGGEVCRTRNGIRRFRGLDLVYLRLPASLSDVLSIAAPRGQGSCLRFDFARLHSICTPLRGRLRCRPVFPGLSVLSKPTPALSKLLRLKCRATSQAGRRGFESRLPLHDSKEFTV
jgi:hypothetical protein